MINPHDTPVLTPEQKAAALCRKRWDAVNFLDDAILPTYRPACLLCGYSHHRDHFLILTAECIFGGGRLERYQCPHCECIFGPRKVTDLHPIVLAHDYKDLYSVYSESDSTASELKAFHLLKPKRNGIYLNYGAGAWSHSASLLRTQGYTVFCFDRFCEGNNQDLLTLEAMQSMTFDGIYSNNVVEHFISPCREFRLLRDRLKRGGAMSHASPCYKYVYEFTRFHTIFYTGRSPEHLARLTDMTLSTELSDGEFMCKVFVKPKW
jgi:hypothetical protein